MGNEGRENVSPAQRKAIMVWIEPELKLIREAVHRVEGKVGMVDSWQRTTAVSFVLLQAAQGFSNMLCSIFGWVENAREKQHNSLHSTSFVHDALSAHHDIDLKTIGTLLSELTQLMHTERYEQLENIAQRRSAKL